MNTFPIHTVETAPEASRPYIEGARKAFGMVPNLIGLLAGSPAMIEGYMAAASAVQKTTLSPLEREVVMIAVSVENDCHYCVAAHTTVTQAQKLDQQVIRAVRDGGPIADDRLEALRAFTTAIVRERGFISREQLEAFHRAGYTAENVQEVVLAVGMKTMSNYLNHIVATPLDAPFQKNAFTPRRPPLA